MTRVQITEADILDALVSASAGPEDARTVVELSRETGLSEDKLRRALKVLADEGRLSVHRVVRRALDGRASTVPAYTIAPKKGKKK